MKILLLGLSGAGKSTLSQLMNVKYNLKVYEADDEVMLINQNVWPDDDSIVDKGFAQANEKALMLDNIIFVTSWLSKTDFNRFVEYGYKAISLHATFDELVNRKITRDNTTQDKIEKFKTTYAEFIEYISDPHINKNILVSIDSTNYSSEELLNLINDRLINK